MTDYSPVETPFYKEILSATKSSLGSASNLENLTSFEQGGIGGFAWFWNLQGNTNQTTYDFMNAATSYDSNTGAVKAATTPATNVALAIYQALQYRLSEVDNTALSQSQTNAAVQANNTVNSWNSSGQPQITDAMMTAVNVNTRIDYIVYQFLNVYSGEAGSVKWSAFGSSRNPGSLFPDMPPSVSSVLGALTQYAAATGNVSTIIDNQNSGSWLKNQLVNSIETPTETNGAITTKDVTSGQTQTVPSWAVAQAVSDLQQTLESSATITIQMQVTKKTETTVNVSVNGAAGGIIPVDFLSFFGSGSVSYNSFSQQGTGSSVDIELIYTGAGVANFSPMAFNQSTLKGWYDENVIAEAYMNRAVIGDQRPSVSGYVLSGLNPTIELGALGNAGYINAAVYSNPPSVKMTYKTGSYSVFKSSFKEESSWGVSLFGIKLFGGSQSYEKAVLKEESTSGGFSISFPPKSITSSDTTAGAQLASIIAVNPQWMGVNSASGETLARGEALSSQSRKVNA